jgi:hypothetical protein
VAAFKKGETGNRHGRPRGVANKVTRDVRALAQSLFDPAYWKRTKAKIDGDNLHPMLEKTLLAYAFGEPKKTLKLEGEVGVKEKRSVLRNLPDDVVRDLVAKAAFATVSEPEETTH